MGRSGWVGGGGSVCGREGEDVGVGVGVEKEMCGCVCVGVECGVWVCVWGCGLERECGGGEPCGWEGRRLWWWEGGGWGLVGVCVWVCVCGCVCVGCGCVWWEVCVCCGVGEREEVYHLAQNDYSFDALQAYCFGINIKL